MADQDILAEAQDRLKRAIENEDENRQRAVEDRRFALLGEQWPEDIQRNREPGRPMLTVNRMPSFLRQVTNEARINRRGITVHPVDSHADPETAEILQGLIRAIEVASHAERAYTYALEWAASGGFGYFRVDLEYAHDDTFDLDIKINRIMNALSVYHDPESTTIDGSDANHVFVTQWLRQDEFESRFPKEEPDSLDLDRHENMEWQSEDMVQIAEYWRREEISKTIVLLSDGSIWDRKDYLDRKEIFDLLGLQVRRERETRSFEVKQYLITGSAILDSTDWPGIYIPIIPVYGDEVIIDNKRMFLSMIHFAKDPQRMLNFWRTASTELVALAPKAPFIGPTGAFDSDKQRWETANILSHPYLEYDGPIAPQRQQFAPPPAGAIQEALTASDDIKSVLGIFDAALGARSNETSGRAIIARQKESDVSTYHILDNLSSSILHCGKLLVDLIPRVFNHERIIRYLGPDEKPQTAMIGPRGAQQPAVNEANSEQQAAIKRQRIFDLSAGKYDVTIDTGPSFATQRQEAATQMMELIRSFPQAAQVVGDLVAKNLDWPGADEIAKRLQLLLPPQIQQAEAQNIPPEAAAIVAQLQQQLQQAQQIIQQGAQKLQELQSEENIKKAELQIKQKEAAIKEFDSQTKRLEVQIKALEAAGKQDRPIEPPRYEESEDVGL